MTLEEWHEVLATEPATPRQVGAVMGEMHRLGLADPADRAERLAVCAELLGLDDLASTRDLTMGEAGELLRLLQDCRMRAGLPVVTTGPEHQTDAAGAGLGKAIAYVMVLIFRAWKEPAFNIKT